MLTQYSHALSYSINRVCFQMFVVLAGFSQPFVFALSTVQERFSGFILIPSRGFLPMNDARLCTLDSVVADQHAT